MLFKESTRPKTRFRLLVALGPLAWLALVMSIFLGRQDNPELDFLTGFLVGFSITGILVYIIVVTREFVTNWRQK